MEVPTVVALIALVQANDQRDHALAQISVMLVRVNVTPAQVNAITLVWVNAIALVKVKVSVTPAQANDERDAITPVQRRSAQTGGHQKSSRCGNSS